MSRPFSVHAGRRWAAALALAVLLCLCCETAAKLFVFKDGFVIEGEPNRVKEVRWMGPQAGIHLNPKDYYFIDDGPRLVVFKHTDLQDIVPTGEPDRVQLLGRPWKQAQPRPMPAVVEVQEATPWDRTWRRNITLRTQDRQGSENRTLPQQIAALNSYFVGVRSTGAYVWSSFYLTRELGPDEVAALLECAPELKETPEMAADKRATLRFRKVSFYLQAGWYRLAEKELDRLVADIPDQKAKADDMRKTITDRRLKDSLAKLKRLHASGRQEAVRKLIASLPRKEGPLEVLAGIHEIESQVKSSAGRIAEARPLLGMAQERASGPHSVTLSRAVAAIAGSLQPENIDRLETFVSQARQYERQQKGDKRTTVNGDQLLALAVSGWLLGSAAADTKPDNAAALWRGRQLVLDYTSANNPAKRKRLLQDYEDKKKDNAALDDIFRMIPSLPPPEADDKPNAAVQARTVAGKNINYQLQLPPEYRHTRSYPLLIVLHNSGEKARDMLDRWRETAGEHGYIVAAPEWGGGFQNGYSYSEAEHETVLSTLRDLRRRFQVDSDRVFLFGLGEGGKMAFDVGLAHPGDFAGVVPMAAAPEMFSSTYWPNGQYLPLYVVHGSQDEPAGCASLKELFTIWTRKGVTAFPSMWVDYKGRGCEWFGGEVNNIFEWMRAKHRAFPSQQLGQHVGMDGLDLDFRSLRPGDNRFYWLSTDNLHRRCTRTADSYHVGHLSPATVSARIDIGARDNTIRVHADGVGEVTVWLGRDSRGADMINFNNPVTVTLNMQPHRAKRKVTPSLETLLEDLYERGDRQQMYLAKIVLRR